MTSQSRRPYREVVAEFARMGADIINTDAQTRYERIGKDAHRRLEPGFIPIGAQPLLTAISYYPNETDLPSPEYANARAHFDRWAETGSVEDYEAAYRGWLSFRDQVPFYRRWEDPLLERLGVCPDETAWLPLVKCPLPAGTAVDREGIDIARDRNLLWDQLNLVQPEIVLVQGAVVYDVVGRSLDNLKFVRCHPLQKIPQYPKGDMMQKQLEDLVRQLKPHIDSLRAQRDGLAS